MAENTAKNTNAVEPLEPWMRGYLADLDPVLAAILYSLQQVREDVDRWKTLVTDDMLWRREGDIAPLGYQLRHLAGSTDRLITYALGASLSEQQLESLRAEENSDVSLRQMLSALEDALQRAEATVRSTDPQSLGEARALGRKLIPTTLGGLLIHTAEHAQRHVGELIVTIKLARQRRSPSQG